MAPHTADSAAEGRHEAAAQRAAGLDDLTRTPDAAGEPLATGAEAEAVGSPLTAGDVETIHGDLAGFAGADDSPAEPGDGDVEG